MNDLLERARNVFFDLERDPSAALAAIEALYTDDSSFATPSKRSTEGTRSSR
jgi:hypothetical protein